MALLPLLLHSGKDPKYLFAALAEQPGFFVQMLRMRDQRKDKAGAGTKPATEAGNYDGERSRSLLDAWHCLPGIQSNGDVNEDILRNWVEGARAQRGRRNMKAMRITESESFWRMCQPTQTESGPVCLFAESSRIGKVRNLILEFFVRESINTNPTLHLTQSPKNLGGTWQKSINHMRKCWLELAQNCCPPSQVG